MNKLFKIIFSIICAITIFLLIYFSYYYSSIVYDYYSFFDFPLLTGIITAITLYIIYRNKNKVVVNKKDYIFIYIHSFILITLFGYNLLMVKNTIIEFNILYSLNLLYLPWLINLIYYNYLFLRKTKKEE